MVGKGDGWGGGCRFQLVLGVGGGKGRIANSYNGVGGGGGVKIANSCNGGFILILK